MSPPLTTPPRTEGPRGLLDQLLHEQQLLTPVAEFARQHERGEIAPGTNRFRDLLPLTPPATGEQYAFEVELDKCSGCKACVTACHSLNGLDDNETWREVGLLINPPKKRKRSGRAIPMLPFGASSARDSGSDLLNLAQQTKQQHVTTACHHCVDPACLNGCPVLAYEKDSVTGIVRHLDDQCIGCQYCVLKCPYDVPKYNDRLGIVRKCDMCSSRLSVGEAPACVQACPNEAIRITKVQTDSVRIEFRERSRNFLSGAPAGDYTLPPPRFLGATIPVGRGVLTAPRRESENGLEGSSTSPRRAADSAPYLIAADSTTLLPQPAHWPLVLMLVLSQASVGATCVAAFARENFQLLLLALAMGVASIIASIFHLGRPLGAWRFFLGLRRSWMSREILMFSLFVPLLTAAVLVPRLAVNGLAAAIGLLGVFCSMMIYHDTRRVLWHWRRSVAWFFGTTLALGCSAWMAFYSANSLAFTALLLVVALKLASEISVLRHVTDGDLTSLKKSALLITGRFQFIAVARILCAFIGGIGLPLLLNIGAFASGQMGVAWAAFALLLAGEILERLLFFRCVDAPKMPGGLHA